MNTPFHTNSQLIRYGRWVSSRINPLEIILGLILLMAFVYDLIYPAPIIFVYVMSFGTLATLYFMLAFAPLNDQVSKLAQVIFKVTTIGLSVSLLGIVYTILHLPLSHIMLIIGTINIVIGLGYGLINRNIAANPVFSNRALIRFLLVLVVCCYFLVRKFFI